MPLLSSSAPSHGTGSSPPEAASPDACFAMSASFGTQHCSRALARGDLCCCDSTTPLAKARQVDSVRPHKPLVAPNGAATRRQNLLWLVHHFFDGRIAVA